MFTGIVERQGQVRSVTGRKVLRLAVTKPASWKFKLGGSIAVDGVCLTVVAQTTDSFSADVVPETVERTTLGRFTRGRKVNLERPLRMGDEIGGHIVQGHVDTRAVVTDIRKRGTSREITLTLPQQYIRSLNEKGSIAINGVSLTIARVEPRTFMVALIPHTITHTNLEALKVSDEVNVEFDTARHVLVARKKK